MLAGLERYGLSERAGGYDLSGAKAIRESLKVEQPACSGTATSVVANSAVQGCAEKLRLS